MSTNNNPNIHPLMNPDDLPDNSPVVTPLGTPLGTPVGTPVGTPLTPEHNPLTKQSYFSQFKNLFRKKTDAEKAAEQAAKDAKKAQDALDKAERERLKAEAKALKDTANQAAKAAAEKAKEDKKAAAEQVKKTHEDELEAFKEIIENYHTFNANINNMKKEDSEIELDAENLDKLMENKTIVEKRILDGKTKGLDTKDDEEAVREIDTEIDQLTNKIIAYDTKIKTMIDNLNSEIALKHPDIHFTYKDRSEIKNVLDDLMKILDDEKKTLESEYKKKFKEYFPQEYEAEKETILKELEGKLKAKKEEVDKAKKDVERIDKELKQYRVIHSKQVELKTTKRELLDKLKKRKLGDKSIKNRDVFGLKSKINKLKDEIDKYKKYIKTYIDNTDENKTYAKIFDDKTSKIIDELNAIKQESEDRLERLNQEYEELDKQWIPKGYKTADEEDEDDEDKEEDEDEDLEEENDDMIATAADDKKIVFDRILEENDNKDIFDPYKRFLYAVRNKKLFRYPKNSPKYSYDWMPYDKQPKKISNEDFWKFVEDEGYIGKDVEEPVTQIPNTLSIFINTRIRGSSKIKYSPKMSVPKMNSDKVFFDPLIRLSSSVVNSIPKGLDQDEKYIQFFSQGQFNSLIQRTLGSGLQPIRTIEEAKSTGVIDDNIRITLDALFKSGNPFFIDGKRFTVFNYEWYEGDWTSQAKNSSKMRGVLQTYSSPFADSIGYPRKGYNPFYRPVYFGYTDKYGRPAHYGYPGQPGYHNAYAQTNTIPIANAIPIDDKYEMNGDVESSISSINRAAMESGSKSIIKSRTEIEYEIHEKKDKKQRELDIAKKKLAVAKASETKAKNKEAEAKKGKELLAAEEAKKLPPTNPDKNLHTQFRDYFDEAYKKGFIKNKQKRQLEAYYKTIESWRIVPNGGGGDCLFLSIAYILNSYTASDYTGARDTDKQKFIHKEYYDLKNGGYTVESLRRLVVDQLTKHKKEWQDKGVDTLYNIWKTNIENAITESTNELEDPSKRIIYSLRYASSDTNDSKYHLNQLLDDDDIFEKMKIPALAEERKKKGLKALSGDYGDYEYYWGDEYAIYCIEDFFRIKFLMIDNARSKNILNGALVESIDDIGGKKIKGTVNNKGSTEFLVETSDYSIVPVQQGLTEKNVGEKQYRRIYRYTISTGIPIPNAESITNFAFLYHTSFVHYEAMYQQLDKSNKYIYKAEQIPSYIDYMIFETFFRHQASGNDSFNERTLRSILDDMQYIQQTNTDRISKGQTLVSNPRRQLATGGSGKKGKDEDDDSDDEEDDDSDDEEDDDKKKKTNKSSSKSSSKKTTTTKKTTITTTTSNVFPTNTNSLTDLSTMSNRYNYLYNSNLTFFVIINLELYPGDNIPLMKKGSLSCQTRRENIRHAFADLFGLKYQPNELSLSKEQNQDFFASKYSSAKDKDKDKNKTKKGGRVRVRANKRTIRNKVRKPSKRYTIKRKIIKRRKYTRKNKH